jgi:ParB-like chromosome segregation protein Spo0J
MSGLTGRTGAEVAWRCSPGTDLDELVSSFSIESQPVTIVRIDSLVFMGSPRRAGADPEHVRLLAESGDALPPITVHRPTRRVIDGVHRVRAALLNGIDHIGARLLDCDENLAFILAVRANVTHGLPLSQPDRGAAAARIIDRHPHWSDRAVAAVTGLSNKTVSRIRDRPTAAAPRSDARIGRDGRLRPLDSGPRRQQAAAMINERPEAGLREIARATGLSAATVRDVRQRLHRGEDPVPQRYRPAGTPDTPAISPPGPHRTGPTARQVVSADCHALLAKLCNDPSLRFNEAGRQALRWLLQHTVDADGVESLGRGLPDHLAPVIADVARNCATVWSRLAEQLDERTD